MTKRKYFFIRSRDICSIQETAIKNNVWYTLPEKENYTINKNIEKIWNKWNGEIRDYCIFFSSERRIFYLIAEITKIKRTINNFQNLKKEIKQKRLWKTPCIGLKPLFLIRDLEINDNNFKKFETFRRINSDNLDRALQGSRHSIRRLGNYESKKYDYGLRDWKQIKKNGTLEEVGKVSNCKSKINTSYIKKVFDSLKSFVKKYERHPKDYLDRNEYLIENFWYIELLKTFNDWSKEKTDFFNNYKVISQHEVVLRRKSKIRHDLAIFTDDKYGGMQELLLGIEIKKDSDSKNIEDFEYKQLKTKQTLLEDYETLIESTNNKESYFGLAIVFTNLKGLNRKSFSEFLHNIQNKAKFNSKRVAVCIVNNNKIWLGIERDILTINKLIQLWKNFI